MKKTVFALLLALCFCLTAACGAEDVLHSIAQSISQATMAPAPAADPAQNNDASQSADSAQADQAQETAPVQAAEEAPVQPASGTDAIPEGDGSAEPEQPAGSGTDFTTLTAEQCVEDLASYEGKIPHIVLDCAGAAAINSRIEAQFIPLAEDPMCEGMYYECSVGAGRVLSILMVMRGPNDVTEYTPFNLDLSTGEELSAAQLLALLNVDAEELKNLEQPILGNEFTLQFSPSVVDADEEFYNQQYERTTSPDNTDVERIWFGGDGQLCFVGRIYSLAGADYYEYTLGTGLFF